MTAGCPVPRGAAVPTLAVVAWQDEHELSRWPLHAMAYGSLVSQLVNEPAGPFAIPHASGFTYDEYAEVGSRLTEARRILLELIPPYNALLHRMSRTERMAGLSANKARNWLTQAEQTLAATKGRELRQLIREVGPPHYATHFSCLPESRPAVQRGTRRLNTGTGWFTACFQSATVGINPKVISFIGAGAFCALSGCTTRRIPHSDNRKRMLRSGNLHYQDEVGSASRRAGAIDSAISWLRLEAAWPKGFSGFLPLRQIGGQFAGLPLG